ncbi:MULTISPECIES: VOC family protein [Caballeronia]|jgi:lactoylglutathione lyase|uniref:Lactoylglutathione lyase n=1 Tax=Caballeronia zhejiangensis TaxID=871203 RepID=A0A656QQC9_9BURK|nr:MULTISPECIES: VOC family protein [Caballeronia]EKS70653.1 lactoylglutathione lyase [Burkholderia sp. SJ98]KDR33704.1 lactoylglutathione lyase [Caballeronia zhejiangensis]MCG7403463.1 VOC family protein [Caballeronia zhejiangensis]MCI1045708.1 VOC family protein [Caballeronia zhejiangensis]MDR5766477.1 VOC family protein [Caballeronia sp. LZ028]
MSKLIHTMIRVQDLQRSLDFYEKAFDLGVAHRLDFPDFTLAYLRNDETNAELELTWNKGRAEPYTHGDGYGHVAVSVPDAKAERERLIGLGLSPNDVREFKNDDGSLIARYFFIQDPDGYKIEVLERHGHYE